MKGTSASRLATLRVCSATRRVHTQLHVPQVIVQPSQLQERAGDAAGGSCCHRREPAAAFHQVRSSVQYGVGGAIERTSTAQLPRAPLPSSRPPGGPRPEHVQGPAHAVVVCLIAASNCWCCEPGRPLQSCRAAIARHERPALHSEAACECCRRSSACLAPEAGADAVSAVHSPVGACACGWHA